MSEDNAAQTIKFMVYSDDAATRQQVMDAIGRRPAPNLPRVEWVEAATSAGFMEKFETEKPVLIIFDGEAAKEGGMSLCRRIHVEYDDVPKSLVICGRPQDHWLATWAFADAVVDMPLNPRILAKAVADLLQQA